MQRFPNDMIFYVLKTHCVPRREIEKRTSLYQAEKSVFI